MREIIFNVNNLKAEPSLLWGGVEREHNATTVVYKLDREFYESYKNALFRIDFSSVGAGYDPSENLVPDENLCLKRSIPQKFTQFGGKMVSTLNISFLENNELLREEISIPNEIFFTENNCEDGEIIKNLSACEEYILSLVKKAEDLVERAQNAKISVDEEIKEISAQVDSCVKNNQFADNKGNAGILRLNSNYGISSGRYNANSPESGDTIIIQTPSNGLIKQRTHKYMPITPSNIDYAVKCALIDSRIIWTDDEKAKMRKLFNIKDAVEYVVNNATIYYGVNYSVKVSEPLKIGEKYTWSYYISEYPGWFIDYDHASPSTTKTEITSVCTTVTVDGKNYSGFTAKCLHWASEGNATVTVYYDEGYIKVKKNFDGESDLITIKK